MDDVEHYRTEIAMLRHMLRVDAEQVPAEEAAEQIKLYGVQGAYDYFFRRRVGDGR